MENSEIIKEMLNDLLQKTIEKKITWKIVNSNAIRWVKSEPSQQTTVTLQKQASANPAHRENYILTIQSPPQPSTQIDSASDPFVKEIFVNLFKEAKKEANRLTEEKKIEVIKSLLKDI
jgi:hypothetical protein